MQHIADRIWIETNAKSFRKWYPELLRAITAKYFVYFSDAAEIHDERIMKDEKVVLIAVIIFAIASLMISGLMMSKARQIKFSV